MGRRLWTPCDRQGRGWLVRWVRTDGAGCSMLHIYADRVTSPGDPASREYAKGVGEIQAVAGWLGNGAIILCFCVASKKVSLLEGWPIIAAGCVLGIGALNLVCRAIW